MIHVKDSLLPMGKVWSTWTSWVFWYGMSENTWIFWGKLMNRITLEAQKILRVRDDPWVSEWDHFWHIVFFFTKLSGYRKKWFGFPGHLIFGNVWRFLGFPYKSRIHTAYIGFRIPPFGWYLKCLMIAQDSNHHHDDSQCFNARLGEIRNQKHNCFWHLSRLQCCATSKHQNDSPENRAKSAPEIHTGTGRSLDSILSIFWNGSPSFSYNHATTKMNNPQISPASPPQAHSSMGCPWHVT